MTDTSFAAIVERISREIDAEMYSARSEQRPVADLLWQAIDYQFGWDLPPNDPARVKVSGKKIRPLLMALVAQAICGSYHHILPAGAALEFLHNFTLMHDDVMDRSLERRHRPTIWARWGEYQAINMGDGLYALANLTMARLFRQGISPEKVIDAHRALSQACLWTAEGQIMDMAFETRDSVSTAEYITMITNKSATLIECAAYTGAMLSTDDRAVITHYAVFARSLGIAFQVRDDYLGVWGDEAVTGKPATSAIREKKKAYPILVAFERAAGPDADTLRRIYAQDALSDTDIQTVLGILERVGAAAETDRIAQQYYDTALNDLSATGIENDTQQLIRQYADFLVRRTY